MTKISVYGTSYVGLVTALCMAERGHNVFSVDIDEDKIKSLQKGISPIFEDGLPELLKKNVDAGKIVFTTNLQEAFNHGAYHFIAVGTPEGKSGEADLTFVNAAVSMIAAARTEPFVIVIKSTVPIGTAKKMREMLLKEQEKSGKKIDFQIISMPEFLRESAAVYDCLHPDRVILGGDPKAMKQVWEEIYPDFIEAKVPVLMMDSESAELTKYASNAMLATKISLMNELSLLADKTGADIEWVRKGMSLDSRIGPHYIVPGCSYGGSCFPKDIKALQVMSKKYNLDSSLLQAVSNVNNYQLNHFCQKIMDYLAKDEQNLSEKTIALWGLSYKSGTDDIRESSAIYIAQNLSAVGMKIRAYDPVAMHQASNFPWIDCAATPFHALKDADALVIATDWDLFKDADLKEVFSTIKVPVIFDGRNLFDLEIMKTMQFDYFSIGRPPVLNKLIK